MVHVGNVGPADVLIGPSNFTYFNGQIYLAIVCSAVWDWQRKWFNNETIRIAIPTPQITQLASSSAIDTSTDVSVTSSISHRASSSTVALKHHSPYGRRRGSYHNDSHARTTTRSYSSATQRSIPTVVIGGSSKESRNELPGHSSRGTTGALFTSSATTSIPTSTVSSSVSSSSSTGSSLYGTTGTTTDASASSTNNSRVRKRADKLNSRSSSPAELTLTATNSVINQSDSEVGGNREALAHEGSEPVSASIFTVTFINVCARQGCIGPIFQHNNDEEVSLTSGMNSCYMQQKWWWDCDPFKMLVPVICLNYRGSRRMERRTRTIMSYVLTKYAAAAGWLTMMIVMTLLTQFCDHNG